MSGTIAPLPYITLWLAQRQIFFTIRLTLGCGSRHSDHQSINRSIRSIEPLVHPSDFKNCIKQYVVLLCVRNIDGYFMSTRQLQMCPAVETGRPRDKNDTAYYSKSSILFAFSEWKLGNRILGFSWGIYVSNWNRKYIYYAGLCLNTCHKQHNGIPH